MEKLLKEIKYEATIEAKGITYLVKVAEHNACDVISFKRLDNSWTTKIGVAWVDEVFVVGADFSGLSVQGYIDRKQVYEVFCSSTGVLTYRTPCSFMDEAAKPAEDSSAKPIEELKYITTGTFDAWRHVFTIMVIMLDKRVTVEFIHNYLLMDQDFHITIPVKLIAITKRIYQTHVLKTPNAINLTAEERVNIIIRQYPFEPKDPIDGHIMHEWDTWMRKENTRLIDVQVKEAAQKPSSDGKTDEQTPVSIPETKQPKEYEDQYKLTQELLERMDDGESNLAIYRATRVGTSLLDIVRLLHRYHSGMNDAVTTAAKDYFEKKPAVVSDTVAVAKPDDIVFNERVAKVRRVIAYNVLGKTRDEIADKLTMPLVIVDEILRVISVVTPVDDVVGVIERVCSGSFSSFVNRSMNADSEVSLNENYGNDVIDWFVWFDTAKKRFLEQACPSSTSSKEN